MRQFFIDRGYLEVETPHRIPPLPGILYRCDPFWGLFLHTSPELCMKRLLAAGMKKSFRSADAGAKEKGEHFISRNSRSLNGTGQTVTTGI